MEDTISFDGFKTLVSDSLGIDIELLNASTSFRDDLGIDSLSIINFIIKLEYRYRIKVNLENVWSLRNIGDIYRYFIECLESRPELSN